MYFIQYTPYNYAQTDILWHFDIGCNSNIIDVLLAYIKTINRGGIILQGKIYPVP